MKRASRTTSFVVAILGAVIVMALAVGATPRAGGQVVQTEDTAKLARELWEKALAAKGGRERLRRVTNIYVAADQGRGDRDWTFTVFPSYWFNYRYQAGREVTSIDVANQKKDVAWWQIGNHEVHPRDFDDSEALRIFEVQVRYLMVTHNIDPVPRSVRKEWVGLKRVNVVETEVEGWRVDYYLDPKTNLPLRMVMESRHTLTFDDYAAVDGIMMPHKVRHTYESYRRRNWTERLQFEINADYNPEIFEQAPTRKTPAEGWRAATPKS